MIYTFYKKIGETMQEALERFKKEYNINKCSYAGRLDPLAHGIIKITTDVDCSKESTDEICNCFKVYQFIVVTNYKSDTYDVMGLAKSSSIYDDTKFHDNMTFLQPYPAYSSAPIKRYKKPFWLVTKHQLEVLPEDIPKKEVTIKYIKKILEWNVSNNDLLTDITDRINLVDRINKFRQDEIIENWKMLLHDTQNIKLAKYEVAISSGGYVRHIANQFGGCCLEIHRIGFEK